MLVHTAQLQMTQFESFDSYGTVSIDHRQRLAGWLPAGFDEALA